MPEDDEPVDRDELDEDVLRFSTDEQRAEEDESLRMRDPDAAQCTRDDAEAHDGENATNETGK